MTAIAIRTQSPDDELALDADGGDLASFILQVRNHPPGLLQRLRQLLAELGTDATLVPVEPIADYKSDHSVAHYAFIESAIDHPPVLPEPTRGYVQASSTNQQIPDSVRFEAKVEPGLAAVLATQRATERGEARLVKWTKDGTLIDGKRLAEVWDVTRQGLDKARERGEIFSVRVGGFHYYPAEAIHFKRDDLALINRTLGQIESTSKLIFLKREHGALGGCTPAQAVEKGKMTDVLRLARAWVHN